MMPIKQNNNMQKMVNLENSKVKWGDEEKVRTYDIKSPKPSRNTHLPGCRIVSPGGNAMFFGKDKHLQSGLFLTFFGPRAICKFWALNMYPKKILNKYFYHYGQTFM